MYWIVRVVQRSWPSSLCLDPFKRFAALDNLVAVEIEGELLEENASGDGQYDAFLNAIRKMYKKKKRQLPQLVDYAVHIPHRPFLMLCVKPTLLGF